MTDGKDKTIETPQSMETALDEGVGTIKQMSETVREMIEMTKRMEQTLGDIYEAQGLVRPVPFDSLPGKQDDRAKPRLVLVKGGSDGSARNE